MKQNAWRNPVYQEGKKLIEAGIDFRLVNEHGEWKEFREGAANYNIKSFNTSVNAEMACGYEIHIEPMFTISKPNFS